MNERIVKILSNVGPKYKRLSLHSGSKNSPMPHYKKFTVVFTLIALMVVGMAAVRPQDDKPKKRNLKVLPKDISHDDLEKVMDSWKAALGVKCNFCHAPSKDSTSRKLDFSLDDKPEKTTARHMFQMAAKINKKYFSFDKDDKDDKGPKVPAITCMTCHRGSPHPGEVK